MTTPADNNKIKFMGKTYDLNNFKGGLTKEDLKNNPKLMLIFEKLDIKENGFNNNVIEGNEASIFNNNLKTFAKDTNLSEKEAEALLASYEIDADYKDLKLLLDTMEAKSKEINFIEKNEKNNSTIIGYKEGFKEEFLPDGTRITSAAESKDNSLKESIKMDIKFQYMNDAQKKSKDIDFARKQGSLIQAESDIIKQFGADNVTSETLYDKDNNLKSKIFTSKDGKTPLCVIEYNKNGDVKMIDTLQENKWIRKNYEPDYGNYSIAELNNDKTTILSETFYLYNDKPFKNTTFNENSQPVQETLFNMKTGKIDKIKDFDKLGRTAKIQHFDNNEELINYEVREFYENTPGISKIQIFNSDNKIEKTTILDLQGNEKNYDAQGNLIEDDNSGKSIPFDFSGNLGTMRISDFENLLSKENSTDEIVNNFNLNQLVEFIPNYKDNPKTKDILKTALTKQLDNIYIDASYAWNIDEPEILDNAHDIVKDLIQKGIEADNIDDMLKISKEVNDKLNNQSSFLPNLYTKNDIANGEIDHITYQGRTGDCWLLASINSISEMGNTGKQYIKDCISIDKKTGDFTIKLLGGKKEYKLSREEINNADQLSNGDIDLRALELAFKKYFEEFQPNGQNTIEGGWERYAFKALSGNEPIEASKENGVIGVKIDNKFIPLTKNNLSKLRHIPITINELSKEDLSHISELKSDIAITANSLGDNTTKYAAHAFYIKDIGQKSVTVKEPNNTGNLVIYSYEDFLKTYNYEKYTLFIP